LRGHIHHLPSAACAPPHRLSILRLYLYTLSRPNRF
jgi:hypothetical protein